MKKLRPEETELIGKWDVVGNTVVEDSICLRIEMLISSYLEKIGGGGWETLYRDPKDHRYWELTYPQGHVHGGGPPRLAVLSEKEARKKYSLASEE